MSRRLSGMIDWRVRQAFIDERAIVLATNKSLAEMSSALIDRISLLEESVRLLRDELSAVKRDDR